MASNPNVNGREFSFASLEVLLDGVTKVASFKSVKYPVKAEEGMVYDAAGRPVGRTRGKVTLDDGSISILHSQWRDNIASVQGWLFKTWTLVVTYSDFGMPTHTDTLKGVRFKGADPGGEEGVDGLYIEIPFSYLDVLLDGVSVFEYPTDAGV